MESSDSKNSLTPWISTLWIIDGLLWEIVNLSFIGLVWLIPFQGVKDAFLEPESIVIYSLSILTGLPIVLWKPIHFGSLASVLLGVYPL